MDISIIYLIHILFSAPVFIYLGYYPEIKNNYVAKGLLLLGIIIILYHAYHLYSHYTISQHISWVNIIHMICVGPLLIFAGYNKSLPHPWSQISLIMGYGALINFSMKYYKSLH